MKTTGEQALVRLKETVFQANRDLVAHGLVTLTFGNASAIDRESGIVAIKPSGVSYETLRARDMVLIRLDGTPIDGGLRPSSDTPTHLALYRAWPEVGGIVHTHSPHATIFAQARRAIPCLGTTHADAFHGPVPLTRLLTRDEVEGEYERNTGLVIADCIGATNPLERPGILVAGHGPFAWGATAAAAVESAVMLEEVAKLALATMQLAADAPELPAYIQEKHFSRKHGPQAYYGQR